jgi:hypothetical protein
MSVATTELTSPFVTGGGGHNFEIHVQSAFVILMLSGGIVPCLPPFPIKMIKLQGKYEGYNTDDCIVFLEDRTGRQKPKLLAQIKHVVSVTENNKTFAEVIRAAWADFRNPSIFDPNCDAVALITGPLSATDTKNTRIILEWARHAGSAQEFLNKVNLSKLSSDAKQSKLNAFRVQLQKANGGVDVGDEELWKFLKMFHLLGYDLDIASGVTLSLVKSHIAQFTTDNVVELWTKVADEVSSFNQNAGTITVETLSKEIMGAFRQRLQQQTMPTELLEQKPPPPPSALPTGVDNETALMFASLIGGWNEKIQGDLEAIKELVKGND